MSFSLDPSIRERQGRWAQVESVASPVLFMMKKDLGAEDPSTLSTMANLVIAIGKQGRHEESEEPRLQLVDTRRHCFGGEHLGTITSMDRLACTYCSQGRYQEAENLQLQVVGRATREGLGLKASRHTLFLGQLGLHL